MSLRETYQSRKQLIADNLNAVGVSDASVNDGLTTLANKILNASGGKTPTVLSINLDKNFLEVGERVTVSGRLTDYDGNPIANASLISHSSHETASMTTDANGEYSIKWYYGTSAYNHVAHHYVTYAGDEVYRDSQSETKDVSFRRTSTLLLETPMITYTDEFDVKGSLTDGLGEPITGATVTLTWNDGSEHTATTTTSPTGGILLHREAVTTAGTYSFQLSFDGGSRYVASNSSVVNVVPEKEESVLNILSPSSGSTVSDSVTVSGTLKDNDNTAMSGKSVSFTLNNVNLGTATVESDGSFSKTVTGLIAGSNSISASFAATTTHTAASQSITVNRPPFDGLSDLSLIAGSQILSYADEQQTPNSQYATLETQLMNDDSPAAIEGIHVGFYDYSDENNPVLLGSDDTDSTGKASFTYHSSGVGDVPIKAVVGSIVSKRYAIEDCLYYSNDYSKIKSDCTSYPISDRIMYQMNPNYQSDVEMTWKLKNSSMPSSWGLGFGDGANLKTKLMIFKISVYDRTWHIFYSTNSQESKFDNGGTPLNNATVNSVFKLTTDNLHKVSLYVDDVLSSSIDTKTSYPLNIRIDDFTASPLELDYLKVKPL